MGSFFKKVKSIFSPKPAPIPQPVLAPLPPPVQPRIIQIPVAQPIQNTALTAPAPVKVQNASLVAEATGSQRVQRSRTAGGTSALKFAPLGGGRSKRSNIKRSVLGGS